MCIPYRGDDCNMALQDSGLASTPSSDHNPFASSGSQREHMEDGDSSPYPSQESRNGSGNSYVVVPQSSPRTTRRSRSDCATARSDLPAPPLQPVEVPAMIPRNEANSAPIGSAEPESQLPCTTPNGATTLQYVQFNVGEVRNSPITIAGKVVGSDVNQGTQGLVPTDGQVAEFSIEFGKVTHAIIEKVKEEKTEKLLLSIAAEMTGPDPDDSIFPGAAEANTIEDFFQLGRKKKWWHWLDFERLILILEKTKCRRAVEIVQQYMKMLSDHVTDRLSVLDKTHPRDEGHWMEMKCQCDLANLTLKAIKKHKQFLVNRLGVPPLGFTFFEAYEGCMVTVWRIHSEVQAVEVRNKLMSIEGCCKFEEPDREIVKATLFTPFPDLFADVKQGTLDVDSLTEAHLCAVNDSLHTLLSLAVKCNRPGIVKKLLEKGLSQKVKDFKATEMKQTAINIAAHKDFCGCLKALVLHGCHPAVPDVAEKVALQYACSNDCVSCVAQICEAPGTAALTGLDWARGFLAKPCYSEAVTQEISKAQARRQREVVTPALFEAARTGELSLVTDVLEEGDDINVKSKCGEWPLYVAAKHGHLDLMKELEEYDSSIQVVGLTNDGNTILHAAVLSHSNEVVEYALQRMVEEQESSLLGSDVNARNNEGESALELATKSGSQEMLEHLLSNGAHPSVPSSCGELLTFTGDLDVQDVLDQHRKAHWLKLFTAMGGKRSPLKQFLRVWQDPYDHNLRSPYGDNMLMMAARVGKSDVVKFLLDSLKRITEDRVLTKFHSALPQGDAFPGSLFQEYMDAKAKPGAKYSSPVLSKYLLMVNQFDGYTAAHCAATSGRVKTLTYILECNPTCVGIQDKQGNTPLHIAAIGNHTSCIKKLMEFASPADVSTPNKKGQFADELMIQGVHFWTLRGKLQAQRRKYSKISSVSCSGGHRAEEGTSSDDMAIDQGNRCDQPASGTYFGHCHSEPLVFYA